MGPLSLRRRPRPAVGGTVGGGSTPLATAQRPAQGFKCAPKLQKDCYTPKMFRFHTKMSPGEARLALENMLASEDLVPGKIDGDTFYFHTTRRRRSARFTLLGRFV